MIVTIEYCFRVVRIAKKICLIGEGNLRRAEVEQWDDKSVTALPLAYFFLPRVEDDGRSE
jgi:hypothetical protein